MEYGIAAPFLVTAVIGAIEVGTVLVVGAMMEGAIRDAARYGVTGQDGLARFANIEQIIEQRTIGLVNISIAQVSTKIYNSFEAIGIAEPYTDDSPNNGQYDVGELFQDINGNAAWDDDQGMSGVGDPGEIVVYQIDYDLPMIAGSFLAHLVGHDGVFSLKARVAVQNEPFDDDI